jgi:RNA:NAD 2'-phosphotransferase (TPT1/KptA family)
MDFTLQFPGKFLISLILHHFPNDPSRILSRNSFSKIREMIYTKGVIVNGQIV